MLLRRLAVTVLISGMADSIIAICALVIIASVAVVLECSAFKIVTCAKLFAVTPMLRCYLLNLIVLGAQRVKKTITSALVIVAVLVMELLLCVIAICVVVYACSSCARVTLTSVRCINKIIVRKTKRSRLEIVLFTFGVHQVVHVT